MWRAPNSCALTLSLVYFLGPPAVLTECIMRTGQLYVAHSCQSGSGMGYCCVQTGPALVADSCQSSQVSREHSWRTSPKRNRQRLGTRSGGRAARIYTDTD